MFFDISGSRLRLNRTPAMAQQRYRFILALLGTYSNLNEPLFVLSFVLQSSCIFQVFLFLIDFYSFCYFVALETEDRGAYCFCPVCHSVILPFV